jgi:hypothetical protein
MAAMALCDMKTFKSLPSLTCLAAGLLLSGMADQIF